MLSRSRRALFTRVCHPRPVPLNARSTSASKRMFTCSLGSAERGRPRLVRAAPARRRPARAGRPWPPLPRGTTRPWLQASRRRPVVTAALKALGPYPDQVVVVGVAHVDLPSAAAVGSPGVRHNSALCSLLQGGPVRYRIAIHQSDEGYSISVPGLPGCWSQGATDADAVANIKDAIREYDAVVEDELRGEEMHQSP